MSSGAECRRQGSRWRALFKFHRPTHGADMGQRQGFFRAHPPIQQRHQRLRDITNNARPAGGAHNRMQRARGIHHNGRRHG